jgi:2-polyprenyl-3-methyl-5-hydroxy-6-metoxy-1,4-benzoquinol methylase
LSGFGGNLKDCKAIKGSRDHYFSKIIRNFFPEDKQAKIIDIGCGRGEFIATLRMHGYKNLLGVDNSEEQVFASNALDLDCIKKGELLQVMQEEVDASFDVVITFDVLEHLTKNEIFLVADEINRLLKPGGIWLIHVPNASSPFFGNIRYGDITHEIAFTQSSLRQIIFSSRFQKINFYEDTPLVKNIRGLIRFSVWKFIRVLLRIYLAAETGDITGHKLLTQNLLAVASK